MLLTGIRNLGFVFKMQNEHVFARAEAGYKTNLYNSAVMVTRSHYFALGFV